MHSESSVRLGTLIAIDEEPPTTQHQVDSGLSSYHLPRTTTDPINLCTSYTNLCTSLQYKFQCPNPVNQVRRPLFCLQIPKLLLVSDPSVHIRFTQVNCEGPTSTKASYASYDGECACGGLNATRLEQNIVYHEISRVCECVCVSSILPRGNTNTTYRLTNSVLLQSPIGNKNRPRPSRT